MGTYDIRHEGSHVIIVDQYGRFVSSADNEQDAMHDIQTMSYERN